MIIFLKIIYHKITLIITNPPIKKSVNKIASILKYLSIYERIFSPKTHINVASKKNLALRLTIDAIINIKKLILKVPADIVMSLNGIGVKPAVKTIQKFQLSYRFFIFMNPLSFIPGTYSKNKLANPEYSTPGMSHHNNLPM